MLTRLLLPLAILAIGGCFNDHPAVEGGSAVPVVSTPVVPDAAATPSEANLAATTKSTQKAKTETTPIHEGERVALQFVANMQEGSKIIPSIAADAELSPRQRTLAIDALKEFIKSQQWNRWFTLVEVFQTKEDSVDCYLRGDEGGLLVLLLGYHYDAKEWRVDAYEIPEITFKRPENESYADYVTRSVVEAKNDAKPYVRGAKDDGRYFLEY